MPVLSKLSLKEMSNWARFVLIDRTTFFSITFMMASSDNDHSHERNDVSIETLLLNYNPGPFATTHEFMGRKNAFPALPSSPLPDQVPWPVANAPRPEPLNPLPADADALSRFAGYDAVVMTYTAKEAETMATLFTPGYPLKTWYQYRHNLTAYIPLVTSPQAPFNLPDWPRYYHSLGLYFPCRIGEARVLLFKSGLHLDHDGPAIPFRRLVDEVMRAVRPKCFISTGTSGAIGADVALGDVVIPGRVRFYCTEKFSDATQFPWSVNTYSPTPIPNAALAAISPALTSVNARKINNDYNARSVPKIWSDASDVIVTTDFYQWDNTADTFRLQGKGRACEMCDAMVGDVMQSYPRTPWFLVRNCSDPQIPAMGDRRREKSLAGEISLKYGGYTTAASVIATWAIIRALVP